MTHRIIANVVPLFTVAFRGPQHVIEELLLPDKIRYAKLPLDAFAGLFFPRPNEYRKCLCIQFRCTEEVDVIRHDHIPANGPSMTVACRAPLLDQYLSDFFASEN
jgi:hypothetical protein